MQTCIYGVERPSVQVNPHVMSLGAQSDEQRILFKERQQRRRCRIFKVSPDE